MLLIYVTVILVSVAMLLTISWILDRRMYRQMLERLEISTPDGKSLIAAYETRIESAKRAALAKKRDPVLQVEPLNQEIRDAFGQFRQRFSPAHKTPASLNTKLRSSLHYFNQLVVNASVDGKCSLWPLFFDWAEILREAGMHTQLSVPSKEEVVALPEALKLFESLNNILIEGVTDRSSLEVSLETTTNHLQGTLVVQNAQSDRASLEYTVQTAPVSLELSTVGESALHIQFRLSNIGS